MSEVTAPLPQERLLIGAGKAAALCGICRSSFLAADKTGEVGPQSVRIGARRLWVLDELRAWTLAGCPARSRWVEQWQQMTKGRNFNGATKGPARKKSEINPELSLPEEPSMV